MIPQNASRCSFDVSVWEFLLAVLVGGERLLMVTAWSLEIPECTCLKRVESPNRITVLEVVPSYAGRRYFWS